MIREIMRDTSFLSQKAESATSADLPVAQDLLDTLTAHKDGCVGMTANMIGVNKRIIAFDNDGSYMVMFNPVIVKRSVPYESEEEQVFRLVAESDEAFTKNCGDIITAHEAFFAGLNKIEQIIVIGHSLSPVDGDYFSEIASRHPDIKGTHWYFGCHGLHDLDRLKQLLTALRIERSTVSVFRTDDIAATPLKEGNTPALVGNRPFEKTRCTSADRRWSVKTVGCSLFIVNQEKQETDYETMFSGYVSDAFFVPSGEYLFAVICGVDPTAFLFHIMDGHWSFVNELESIRNQSVMNLRLRHVFRTAREITFVYNSRVRSYSLTDGMLVSNRGLRNAGSLFYDGEEISHLFLKRK